MMRATYSGTIYFVVVFAVGFVLGAMRTLLLVPQIGQFWAVMAELPIILGIAWLVCARILRCWPLTRAGAVQMGAVAFLLLMIGEAGVSMLLAGRSLAEHLNLYTYALHQLGLAGQLAFAALPWIQTRESHAASHRAPP